MLDQPVTQKLLTVHELETLAGAVTAVFFITQGLRFSFGLKPKYVGLFVSFLVAAAGVWVSADHSTAAWIISIPNAFVIFASATGTATMAEAGLSSLPQRSQGRSDRKTEEVKTPSARRFWGSWF
jgi:hypothetical protein